MQAEMLLPLSQSEDISVVGGKAASLAKLIKRGFCYEGGFVVTIAAFNRLTPKIESEILENFDKLSSPYVAVRSSAVAEDGSKDAWAGQLDTYLNISRGELLEAIKNCWSSAASERAKSYAKQKNIKAGKVAVIVQPMVQSDVAGVAFSIHPVTKNASQMVIEAGLGLGEAVVSGQITPDTYVVDKKSAKVVEKHISNQSRKLVQGSSGKSQWQDLGTSGGKQKLSEEKIIKLAKKITELEEFYGFPIDAEWVVRGSQVFIMQSRPITTLS